jgi:hypothetical protein
MCSVGVRETGCVLCTVGTEILDINHIKFGFDGLKLGGATSTATSEPSRRLLQEVRVSRWLDLYCIAKCRPEVSMHHGASAAVKRDTGSVGLNVFKQMLIDLYCMLLMQPFQLKLVKIKPLAVKATIRLSKLDNSAFSKFRSP